MRLIVKEIEQDNDMTIIKGDTGIGTIRGIWKGDEYPVVGNGYFVELTIEKICNQVFDILDTSTYIGVWLYENIVLFRGVCEDIDEEVYYIRFKPDWLEMVEIVDFDDEKKRGECVSFSVRYENVLIFSY